MQPYCLFQPLGVEELSAWAVGALVGVGAEVVALGLKHVCREVGATVTVVVLKSCSEGR